MNKLLKKINPIFYILFFNLLMFLPMFFRNKNIPFFGGDPYYYLTHIISDTNLHVHNSAFSGVRYLFSIFPTNILYIYLILFVVAFLCGFIFYLTIEKIRVGNGLWGVAFLYSLFWFNWIFLKLENDLFGFLFVLLSLYLVVSYIFDISKKDILDVNIICSITFITIALYLWGFSVYYVFVFAIITKHFFYYLYSLLLLLFFSSDIISRLLPVVSISENQPFVGIIFIVLLFFLFFPKNRVKEIWYGVLISAILCIINLKMIYIFIPILLLNFSQIHFTKIKKTFLISLCFVLFVFSFFICLFSFPSNLDYTLFRVTQTSDIFIEKGVYYSWSVGYFVRYHGVNQIHYGSHPSNQKKFFSGFVYTVLRDPFVSSCEIVQTATNTGLFYCSDS
jgi:hypothetical protein